MGELTVGPQPNQSYERWKWEEYRGVSEDNPLMRVDVMCESLPPLSLTRAGDTSHMLPEVRRHRPGAYPSLELSRSPGRRIEGLVEWVLTLRVYQSREGSSRREPVWGHLGLYPPGGRGVLPPRSGR